MQLIIAMAEIMVVVDYFVQFIHSLWLMMMKISNEIWLKCL